MKHTIDFNLIFYLRLIHITKTNFCEIKVSILVCLSFYFFKKKLISLINFYFLNLFCLSINY